MTKDTKEGLGCILLLLLLAAAVSLAIWGVVKWDDAHLSRVHDEGKAAAAAGIPSEACPYGSGWGGYPRERKEWLQGWAEGWKEQRCP